MVLDTYSITQKQLLGIVLVLYIVGGLGVGIGTIVGDSGQQTVAGCTCHGIENGEFVNITGKNLCNTFSRKDYVFLTGILNVYTEESGNVGVVCENGKDVGEGRRITEQGEYRVNTFLPELLAFFR